MDKVAQFAHEGLPIVISGGTPFNLSGYNVSGEAYVKSALASITSLENVHEVPAEDLSASLATLGLAPRTSVAADRIWYTYWREDEQAAKTYVFVYNDAWDSELGLGGSNGSVTFNTTGVPYFYDAWTGSVEAIHEYDQTASSTTISFSLAGNQSTIVGFHHDEPTSDSKHGTASRPTGYQSSTKEKGGEALNLTSWTLIVESWSAPENLTADQTESAKSNSTWELSELQPWNTISDSLFNVSGRGFYNTTFSWPSAGTNATGAILDLGAIINTARAWVNGHQLPPLDPTHAVADISKFLEEGKNDVLVVVATTLGNAVRPYWGQLKSSGTLALGPLPPAQEYGLVSDVLIKSYST